MIIILQYTGIEYAQANVPWNLLFGVAALMTGKNIIHVYRIKSNIDSPSSFTIAGIALPYASADFLSN